MSDTAPQLILLATYRRTIHASLERIWENVLDWEHLPWLHRSSFAAIQLLEQTTDMWRAQVTLAPAEKGKAAVIEVSTDKPHLRYWSRTLAEQGTSGEIFTALMPVDEYNTDIVVEFRVPQIAPAKVDALAAAYLQLYARLWDEDERMMRRRQELLEQGWRGVDKQTVTPIPSLAE